MIVKQNPKCPFIICVLYSFLQHPGHAGNLHQYLHHTRQHPLHLCHILLHQGRAGHLDSITNVALIFFFLPSPCI